MDSAYTSSKILTIIKHEYTTKIKSKGFIISTILGPLILITFFGVIVLVTMLTRDSSAKMIAVFDETGLQIDKKIVNKDKSRFQLATSNSEDILQSKVLNEEIDGYLVIPKDFLKKGEAIVYTRGGGGTGFVMLLDNILSRQLRIERLLKNGTDTSVINLVEQSADIITKKITQKVGASKGSEKGITTEKDFTEAYAVIGYFLGFFIYFMMFLYGGFVMRSVIEEKVNRIIEVIASSARPQHIMLGKILGIGAVGLTQVLIWVSASAILLAAAGPIISSFMPSASTITQGMATTVPQGLPFEIPKIPWYVFVAFVFYFISGYFIYSTMFAAIGSAVDQESDAAQLQTPVMLPIILPMMFMPAVMSNPDSTLSTVLSLIPFFSPILMIVRIAATNVPIWQIAASVLLLVLTFWGLVAIASKIYRIGILKYGKKPKLSDLIKWIRMSN